MGCRAAEVFRDQNPYADTLNPKIYIEIYIYIYLFSSSFQVGNSIPQACACHRKGCLPMVSIVVPFFGLTIFERRIL